MRHPRAQSGPGKAVRLLYKIEETLLVGLLTAMLALAVAQIVGRNFFQSGIVWGDVAVRILVLWVGLVGAMVAARQNKHITIDILSRHLPRKFKGPITAIVNLFAAATCGVAAYFSFRFVRFEYLDGATAFGSVPIWVAESIIPVAMGIMAIRYFILMANALFPSTNGTNGEIHPGDIGKKATPNPEP